MSETEKDNLSISSDEIDKMIDESHKLYTSILESTTQMHVFIDTNKITTEYTKLKESKISPDLYTCDFSLNNFRVDNLKSYKFLLLTKIKIVDIEYKLCMLYENIQKKQDFHPLLCKYIIMYIGNTEYKSVSLTYNPIKLENFIIDENKITVNLDILEIISIFDSLELEKTCSYDASKFKDDDYIYHVLDNSY
jgi:hypothetical protein